MDRFISPEDGFKIEKAISFLVSQYNESGHNPKPVILHSLRVGMQLFELGYEADAVVVGILHDLIEDTDTTMEDIEKEFGAKIAQDVLAVSFKSEIADYVEQYQEMFKRTVEAGRIPIVVKAADLYANSIYIHLIPSVAKQRQVLGKSPYFLELTESLAVEPVLAELKKRYEQEDSRLKKLEGNLSMRGVPLNAVQALMGHSTIQMTMRYAQHLAPSTLRQAIDMLNPTTAMHANLGQPAGNMWIQTQLKEAAQRNVSVKEA